MKKLQLIAYAIFTLLTFSCGGGTKDYAYYHLANGTNYDVSMKFYKYDSMYNNISLAVGQSYTGSAYSGEGGCGRTAYCALDTPDSLVIIFDDNRKAKIIWNGDNTSLGGIDKNLLSDEAYTIEDNENYRYVFTEQDYDNAIEF
ncbi:hypothetical protein SAMN06265379_10152 [Saccharicrinis carchari]|uniref:Lipoprotein n=1 Tax=Saccharicrinis carchari TaxID=1168039 RepID=A0A521ADJ2_SACCC|nr:hypothetical protein [Saccharicrinis carchari]SMO32760.1 hypothetical protein SAMN06265379_10152 [Saccharicrinis carchari]